MIGIIKHLIEELEKLKSNFKKNPSRKYTSDNLLVKSQRIKEIVQIYKENYKKLLEAQYDPKTLENLVKHKFYSLINDLELIIKEKIELLILDQIDVDSLSSLDYFEEFKEHFEHRIEVNAPSEDINMAIDKLKALKYIPQLAADGCNLSSFLIIVEEFQNLSQDAEEIKNFIAFIIKSKLNEKTLRKVQVCENVNNTETLGIALRSILKPLRTSLQIQSDLSTEKQGHKKLSDFSSKIEELTTELSNIRLSTIANEEFKRIVRKEVDETGLNAFRIGLSEPFKTVVYASHPETLSKAIELAKDFESSISHSNDSNANVYKINDRGYNSNNGRSFRKNQYNHYNSSRNNQYNNRNNNRYFNNWNQNYHQDRNSYNSNNNYHNNRNNNFRNNNYRNNNRSNRPPDQYRNARINQLNEHPENIQDPGVQFASG